MLRFIVILAGLAAVRVPAAAPSKSQIGWKNQSEALWQMAKEQGKPLLVEVWADWCAPCKRMDREVWNDARVIAEAGKFVAVSVDVSRQSAAIAEDLVFGTHGRYEIKVLPSIMVLDPWREMVILNEGFIYAQELAAILREIPPDFSRVRPWREALIADRNNSRALARVGELYQESSAFGIANRYYREALKASGAVEDPGLRQDLMFGIAMNEIRRADWGSARKALEQFNSEFSNSRRMDQVLLGLVLTDVRQGKMAAAEKRFEQLQAAFPDSDAVPSARRLIEQRKAVRR